MMTITTRKEWCDGYDAFKLTGSIDYGDYKKNAKVTISATGANKHEAVERAVSQIDSVIDYLTESKAKLAEI